MLLRGKLHKLKGRGKPNFSSSLGHVSVPDFSLSFFPFHAGCQTLKVILFYFFFNKLRKSGVHPPVQEDQNPQSEYVYVQTSTNICVYMSVKVCQGEKSLSQNLEHFFAGNIIHIIFSIHYEHTCIVLSHFFCPLGSLGFFS